LDAVHKVSMHMQSTIGENGLKTMTQHQKLHMTDSLTNLNGAAH